MLIVVAVLLGSCSVASLASPTTEEDSAAAAESTTLEPTPEPEAPPCQTLPMTVTDVLTVPSHARVGCLSGVSLRFDARLIECRCDVDGSAFFPTWLDGGSQPLLLVERAATAPPDEYEDWLIVRIHPTADRPTVLPLGEIVHVTGLFDHPEAANCTREDPPTEAGSVRVTDECRYFFVTTSLTGAVRPSDDPSPSPEGSATSEPSPEPTPSPDPTATPTAGTTPTATPKPMPVMFGEGVSSGLPFLFTVWVDHEGGGHGTFAGRVPGGVDSVAVDGPVNCARIEGATGVFGWHSPEQQVAFTALVSDDPDGILILMGAADCSTQGAGDAASHPITEGQIEVIPAS